MDKSILKLLHTINNIFGEGTFAISDRWDTPCDIGLQKGSKLIYISTFGCKKGRYFYQCELLLNDPNTHYIAQDTETNVTEEQLLKVMGKFFGIKKKAQVVHSI